MDVTGAKVGYDTNENRVVWATHQEENNTEKESWLRFRAICFYFNLAYSALACRRIGKSESASFQRAKKSWYAFLALVESPDIA